MSPAYWDYSKGPLPKEVQEARANLIRAKHAWQDEVDRAWIGGAIAVLAVLAISTAIMVLSGHGPH